jgi:hypothetical protein
MVVSALASIALIGGLILLMGVLTGFGRGRRRAAAGSDGSAGWTSSGSDCDSGSDAGCDGGSDGGGCGDGGGGGGD